MSGSISLNGCGAEESDFPALRSDILADDEMNGPPRDAGDLNLRNASGSCWR